MRHGGDIDGARAAYGEPEGGWLDLSTGINPDAYPVGDIPAEAWQRLPQAGAEARLVAAARGAYGVPHSADVACAPGTQVLIQLVARLRAGARVAVAGPTYSEHAIAWAGEGASVATAAWGEGADADVLVVVNPNNPDGRVVGREEILAAADRLALRGGLIVVDEAFADTCPGVSVSGFTGGPGLVVLRSFGKFYGLAGVRLGFALGPTAEISRLKAWLGPWATSGPALDIGARALADAGWAEAARGRIAAEAAEVAACLSRAGLAVVGGCGLFTLASHRAADRVHAELARRGIWVRRFENEPTWLRFGLPGDQMERFARALGEAVREAEGSP